MLEPFRDLATTALKELHNLGSFDTVAFDATPAPGASTNASGRKVMCVKVCCRSFLIRMPRICSPRPSACAASS